jgi:SAM-dependent methyltransferase
VRSDDNDAIYGTVAEFYDLTAAQVWESKSRVLASALTTAVADQGPVLDVGAGTGLSTAAIADAVPGVGILAIEPCPQMRTALSTRVASSPDLRDRVTVEAESMPGARLPESLSAAVLCGVVGHVSPKERAQLWHELSTRLTHSAPVVVELMDRMAPPEQQTLRIASAQAGAYRYEVWNSGGDVVDTDEDGADIVEWTHTYRVLDGDDCRRELAVPLRWRRISIRHLARETAPVGFQCHEVAPDIAVLSRSR